MTRVTRHSKATGLSPTRGALTRSEATGVRPASWNSSTSGGTAAQVAFIASASGRVTRFHTNSPVARALRRLSFSDVLEKPISGGV